MNSIYDLWSGRIGLAKSYWLWGILSGIPWGIAISMSPPGSNLAVLVLLAFLVYYLIVHVGIWRSASGYEGNKAWAILAKIAVATTPACLVVGTLAAVIIPASNQSSEKIQETRPTTQIAPESDKPTSGSINSPQTQQESAPELDCEPTGEPPTWIDGQKFTPVKCKDV